MPRADVLSSTSPSCPPENVTWSPRQALAYGAPFAQPSDFSQRDAFSASNCSSNEGSAAAEHGERDYLNWRQKGVKGVGCAVRLCLLHSTRTGLGSGSGVGTMDQTRLLPHFGRNSL